MAAAKWYARRSSPIAIRVRGDRPQEPREQSTGYPRRTSTPRATGHPAPRTSQGCKRRPRPDHSDAQSSTMISNSPASSRCPCTGGCTNDDRPARSGGGCSPAGDPAAAEGDASTVTNDGYPPDRSGRVDTLLLPPTRVRKQEPRCHGRSGDKREVSRAGRGHSLVAQLHGVPQTRVRGSHARRRAHCLCGARRRAKRAPLLRLDHCDSVGMGWISTGLTTRADES